MSKFSIFNKLRMKSKWCFTRHLCNFDLEEKRVSCEFPNRDCKFMRIVTQLLTYKNTGNYFSIKGPVRLNACHLDM